MKWLALILSVCLLGCAAKSPTGPKAARRGGIDAQEVNCAPVAVLTYILTVYPAQCEPNGVALYRISINGHVTDFIQNFDLCVTNDSTVASEISGQVMEFLAEHHPGCDLQ